MSYCSIHHAMAPFRGLPHTTGSAGGFDFNARALKRVIHFSVERKHSEQMLRERRGRLNAILEFLSDPMIMLDQDLSITWSNGATLDAILSS